ncbi:hypothetical protein TNCV_1552061 [Trichonephila clavipes]|nr:hypothetical protein TNCV_1552061 [Trichonephila clavipes]
MIVQFRNEKVSNHGSIPITIDCNVVAFIVFEEGFHQPIKRTKQHPFTLKHVSDQEHDLVEEPRSDDERRFALQSVADFWGNTPLRQKCAAASTTTYLRLRRAGIEISLSTPSTKPVPTYPVSVRASLEHVQNRKFFRPTL